eukprot:gene2584-2886_t
MAQRAQTLAEALNAGRDVFERARASLDQLPQPDADVQAPATLSDAVQLVQERQSLQQQHKEPKPKQKTKEPAPADPAFPGTRIGGGKDNSAYWTLVDDYFRDVTRQDVVNLLSFCIDPDRDDALLVPQLGRAAAEDMLAALPQPPLHRPVPGAAATAANSGLRGGGVAGGAGLLLYGGRPPATAGAAGGPAAADDDDAQEGPLEAQWQQLDEAADELALAPDDEVLAELLTLQGELLQQVAINRSRLALVLQAALDDIPAQRAAAAERASWEGDMLDYLTVSAITSRTDMIVTT